MGPDNMAFDRRRAMLAIGSLAALPVHAQGTEGAWPHKAARIINPFPVGSGPDGLSRLIADKLGRHWGKPVVVENRPGGNGFIAIQAFKRGAADGTSMIQLDNVHVAAYPHLFKHLPYQVDKDFSILLPLFRNYFFVCVPQRSSYQTIGDLIADARARPGQLHYGSWSVGNPVHLGSALLESLTSTVMEHVVYKETSQLYQGVANGELSFALGSLGTAGPLMRAGKLRFLAVAAPQRIAGFKNVPTVSESGGPADYVVTGWNAIAVHPGTPTAVQDKIRNDIRQALTGPDVEDKFSAFGYESYRSTAAEFQQFIADESQRFGAVIRQAAITLD